MLGEATTNRQTSLLKYYEEYKDVQAGLDEMRTMRKEVRGRIKESFVLKAWDYMLKFDEMAGEVREAVERDLYFMMGAIGKPFIVPDDLDAVGPSEITEVERRRIDGHGFVAGRANADRVSNPWNLGSEHYQIWDGGWLRGRDTLAEAPEEPPAPRRGPGRPRGSRNRTNGAADHA